jgi:Ala-tRNA(Pro) deacylase
MSLSARLREYLDSHQAHYTATTHRPAFTANDVASAEHLPAREMAKTLIVFGDDRYHMLVVPASRHLDMREVQCALGLRHVRLATEIEMTALFPDCELGAMPPIGQLYDLPVYLDSLLAHQDTIAFNAGTHRDTVHMRMSDYHQLVAPKVTSLVQSELTSHAW